MDWAHARNLRMAPQDINPIHRRAIDLQCDNRKVQIEPSGKSNNINLVPEAGYTDQTNSSSYLESPSKVKTTLDSERQRVKLQPDAFPKKALHSRDKCSYYVLVTGLHLIHL